VNLAEQLVNLRDRLNAMSLRERLLVLALVAAAVLIGWQSLLMDPLERRRAAAIAELDGMRQRLAVLEQGQSAAGDPLSEALNKERALQAETARIEAELALAKDDHHRVRARKRPYDELLAAGTSPEDVLHKMLAKIRIRDNGIATIYFGQEIPVAQAEQVGENVRAKYPQLQVEVVHGGQPHYSYIVSVE